MRKIGACTTNFNPTTLLFGHPKPMTMGSWHTLPSDFSEPHDLGLVVCNFLPLKEE
jgi:hypothetical protein